MFKIKVMLLGLSLIMFSIFIAITAKGILGGISFYTGIGGFVLTIFGFFENEK